MEIAHGAAFWRKRAIEAQERATEMHDEDAKKLMRQIALMYDAMALRVEVREAEAHAPSPNPASRESAQGRA